MRFLPSASSKAFDMMYMKEVIVERHRAEELVLFFSQHHTRISIEADATTINELFLAVNNSQTVTPDKTPAMDVMSVTSSSSMRQHRLMSSSGYTPPLKRSNSLPQLSPGSAQPPDKLSLASKSASYGHFSSVVRQLYPSDGPANPPAPQPKAPSNRQSLTPQQQSLVALALQQRNLCITGPAGTGKSRTLRAIAQQVGARCGRSRVFVLAASLSPALQAGGCPVSVFLGHSGKVSDDASPRDIQLLALKLSQLKAVRQRCRSVRLLVIDDIFQMSIPCFMLLHEVLQLCRDRQGQAMGGAQLVVAGDPLLPGPSPAAAAAPNSLLAYYGGPVASAGVKGRGGVGGRGDRGRTAMGTGWGGRHLFQLPLWASLFPAAQSFALAQPLRFADAEAEPASEDSGGGVWQVVQGYAQGAMPLPVLSARLHAADKVQEGENGECSDGEDLPPLRIFASQRQADHHNATHLRQVHGAEGRWEGEDAGDQALVRSLRALLPPLTLKLGCAVLLLTDLPPPSAGLGAANRIVDVETNGAEAEEGKGLLARGARGVVTALAPLTVRFEDGSERAIPSLPFSVRIGDKVVAVRKLPPLAVGAGASVGSVAGMTLRSAAVDLPGEDAALGKMYAAVSRLRSIDGLQLLHPLAPKHLAPPPAAVAYLSRLRPPPLPLTYAPAASAAPQQTTRSDTPSSLSSRSATPSSFSSEEEVWRVGEAGRGLEFGDAQDEGKTEVDDENDESLWGEQEGEYATPLVSPVNSPAKNGKDRDSTCTMS
eukprot:gene29850-36040_t